METLILLLALAIPPNDECDSVHGVGCVMESTARCSSCGTDIEKGFDLCSKCAAKQMRCVCGKRKKVHAMIAERTDASMIGTADVYRSEVEAVRKHADFGPKEREDGRFSYAYSDGSLKGRFVYVRFVKIDVAGGPPGKYEFAILSRRIVVLSCVEVDPAKSLTVKGARVFDAGAEIAGTEVPPAGPFEVIAGERKMTLTYKDGWTLDGKPVKGPLDF